MLYCQISENKYCKKISGFMHIIPQKWRFYYILSKQLYETEGFSLRMADINYRTGGEHICKTEMIFLQERNLILFFC